MSEELQSQPEKDNEMGRDPHPSTGGVSAWILGKNVPSANNLRLILKVLKCSPDDLYDNDKFSGRRLAMVLELNKLSQRDFADKLFLTSRGLDI